MSCQMQDGKAHRLCPAGSDHRCCKIGSIYCDTSHTHTLYTAQCWKVDDFGWLLMALNGVPHPLLEYVKAMLHMEAYGHENMDSDGGV